MKQLWIQKNGKNYLYELQETKEAKNYLDLIMKNYELYEIQKEEDPNEILEGFTELFKENAKEEHYTFRKFEEKNKKCICYVPSTLNSIMEDGMIQLDSMVNELIEKEELETLSYLGSYLDSSRWKEKDFESCDWEMSIQNTIGYYKLFKTLEQEMNKNKMLMK